MKFKTNVDWHWYADRNLASMTVDLWLVAHNVHGKVFQKRFTEEIKETEEGMVPTDSGPTLTLDYEEAQFLSEQLYDAGFVPEKYKKDLGEVEALKEHINSLRRVIELVLVGSPEIVGIEPKKPLKAPNKL